MIERITTDTDISDFIPKPWVVPGQNFKKILEPERIAARRRQIHETFYPAAMRYGLKLITETVKEHPDALKFNPYDPL